MKLKMDSRSLLITLYFTLLMCCFSMASTSLRSSLKTENLKGFRTDYFEKKVKEQFQ